jgi:excisionase family DNA binding protein
MAQISDLMTTRELARQLRVSDETVRAWARRGLIPTVQLSPKVIRYNLEAVLAARSTAPVKGVTP